MSLPDFDDEGDLPVGIHPESLPEVIQRFGTTTRRRQELAAHLTEIYRLAKATGKLDRFIIFGSYVTAKAEPNDVDVVLIMQDDFELAACGPDSRSIFLHQQAVQKFRASIFWIRPAMLFLQSLDQFIIDWQIKRDGTRRGIVEVTDDS